MSPAKQSSRTPLWAAVVLLAAIASLAWLHLLASPGDAPAAHDGHAHADPDIARGRKVLPHPLEEVSGIVLTRGSSSVRISRADGRDPNAAPGTWMFVGDLPRPVTSTGDAEMRIAAFSRLRMEKEYALSPEREREFGLAGSSVDKLEVRIILADDESLAIRFGDLAPDGISRYVRISEPALLATVPDFHYRNLVDLAAPGFAQ